MRPPCHLVPLLLLASCDSPDGKAPPSDSGCDASTALYADLDGDGYGDAAAAAPCDPGGVEDATDCDDGDAAIHPGAAEDCTLAVDSNCDGNLDYADDDGDGAAACEDCDDRNVSVAPGATEVCNGVDDDCDGTADEGVGARTWYADADADGYGDAGATVEACEARDGYVADNSDCDDTDPTRADTCGEVWRNGLDDDGDGTIDTVFTDDADATLVGEAADDHAGGAVAGPGDVDGARAPLRAARGLSGSAGLGDPGVKFLGSWPPQNLGIAIAGVGDTNGDGLDDLLVSDGNSTEGTSFLFLGQ